MAAAPRSATKEIYGPAAPSLEGAEKRIQTYSGAYDKEATGKSNLQKAMDASRKVFNEGYGDDMFKNNGKSRAAIADVKAQLKSGKITQAQATVVSTKILDNFERERIRVTRAQANNAEIGKGVHAAGRVVTVAGSAIGGTLVAGPVGGIAAATVAGSAYDAATKLDQGSSRFSHQFDVSNSVGGVTARLIKGEQVHRGDWARGAAGSGMDAISGAFAGGGMLSAKAAQTVLLTAAKQTGVKVSLTAMAKAAALSNVRTGVVQTAATTGYKTLTIMGDRSLTAKERSQLVRKNIKDTVKRAPFDIASGAGMAFVGVKVQLPHKVADGVLQYGMDVVSNGAQKSLENFIAKKDGRLSTEDMAAVLTQSAGGTLNNMVQRVPQVQRGGGGIAAQGTSTAPRPRRGSQPTAVAGASNRPQARGNRAAATVAGSAPQPENARPLPAAVETVATRLGLSVADVQLLRDSLGGTFGAQDAVDHLQHRSNSPLDASQATELVKTIRSSQSASTRGVKAAIEAALAREASPGTSQSKLTKADWDTIEPLLNAQPALDNAAARRLRSLLQSARVDPQAKEHVTDYLKSVGDEFTVPAGRSTTTAAESVPTSNLSTTDAGFAKLLILAGQSKAQVNVGVADMFSTTAPGPSVLFNSQAVPPGTSCPTEHGHGVTSLVGKAGRWVNIKTVMLPDTLGVSPTAFSQPIHRLAAENVRVINISLGLSYPSVVFRREQAHDWRAAMAQHPDVLFVIAAGNDGQNSTRLSFSESAAAGMPNVIYVGNVDAAGNLAKSSTHGGTVDIYAPGEDRQVVRGLGKAYDVMSGTSFSSPEVVSVLAKMLVLCPTLTPAAARAIIQQTASAPPVGATDVDGSVARAGILNGDAATKVAAMMTLTQRVGGLEKAANAMKLSAPDRSRLLPVAQRQLALASSPARSAAQTSGTRPVAQTDRRSPQTTTPAQTHGVRVHHIGSEAENRVNGQRVTDEQISRLAGGTDATLIDVFGSDRRMNVYAVSKHHGDSIELEFRSNTNISIYREALLWRAGLSDGRLVAEAETRALAIMATQAQALGLTTISINVRPGTVKAAEWAERGFSVALPNTKNVVNFDLTSGSRSWRQLVQKVKSSGIQLPAGLPADALSANDAATQGFFRKFLGR